MALKKYIIKRKLGFTVYLCYRVQIGKGGVQDEVGHSLFFVDDQTLMKVVALFGEEAVKVVQALKGVHEVTDKEIADKTQTSVHMVRKALYKLYDHFLSCLGSHGTRKPTGLFTIGGFSLTSSMDSSHP